MGARFGARCAQAHALLALAALLPTAAAHGFLAYPNTRGALCHELVPHKIDCNAPNDTKVFWPAGTRDVAMGAALALQKREGRHWWTPFAPLRPRFKWRTGVCGDMVSGNEHLRGGAYYYPPRARLPRMAAVLRPGGVLDATVRFIAHHNGFIEFHLCDVTKCAGGDISVECFRKGHCVRLRRARNAECDSGNSKRCGPIDRHYPGRWYLPCSRHNSDERWDTYGPGAILYRVPKTFRSRHAVLHWHWSAGHKCNPPGVLAYYDGPDRPRGWQQCPGQAGALGGVSRVQPDCGGNNFPEEYNNCADVVVAHGDVYIGPPRNAKPKPTRTPPHNVPPKPPQNKAPPQKPAWKPQPPPKPQGKPAWKPQPPPQTPKPHQKPAWKPPQPQPPKPQPKPAQESQPPQPDAPKPQPKPQWKPPRQQAPKPAPQKPAQKPAWKSPPKPAGKPPPRKPAGKPPQQKPAGKPPQKAPKPPQKPAWKPQQQAPKPPKPAPKPAWKPAPKPAPKPAGKPPKKAPKAPQKPARKPASKPPAKPARKPASKRPAAPAKSAQAPKPKPAWKPPQRKPGKRVKPPWKPGPKQAPKPAPKPAKAPWKAPARPAPKPAPKPWKASRKPARKPAPKRWKASRKPARKPAPKPVKAAWKAPAKPAPKRAKAPRKPPPPQRRGRGAAPTRPKKPPAAPRRPNSRGFGARKVGPKLTKVRRGKFVAAGQSTIFGLFAVSRGRVVGRLNSRDVVVGTTLPELTFEARVHGSVRSVTFEVTASRGRRWRSRETRWPFRMFRRRSQLPYWAGVVYGEWVTVTVSVAGRLRRYSLKFVRA